MHQEDVALPIGTIIRGRYRVEQILDARSFDAVYLVRDQQDEQQMYVLKERFEPSKRARDRFIFECVVRKPLYHPALPHVYRVFEDDGQRAYMVMQYISGSNLETLRQQRPNKRYALLAILSVLAPVKDAVAYLHRHYPPIVHRAIKPANILLLERNRVVLVNYGFDKAPPDGTSSPLSMCSPGYSAPEQYSGESTPRTDIYGLGATIYALLTGVVPPDAYTRTTQLLSSGVDPLMKANHLTRALPGSVANILHQALSIESENRFATVDEFWLALNIASIQPRAFDALPTTSSALPALPKGVDTAPILCTPRPSASPLHRRKWRVLFLIVLTLVIGAGVALSVWASALNTPRPGIVATPTPGHVQTAIPSIPTATITSFIVSMYSGTIHDIPANVTTTVLLANIQQTPGAVSGSLSVGSGLRGSGPFKGTVSATKHLQFMVFDAAGHATLAFEGMMQPDGDIAGSYCQLDASGHCSGDYGVWSVAPVSP